MDNAKMLFFFLARHAEDFTTGFDHVDSLKALEII